ncbi:MAG: DUF2070 family protein [Methanocellales archaeon]|nr:DUF2070 family protein [Methanocellales archaeon]MDD3291524.1 DUF2070 family protein [Methanocellales archaeon]MDD5485306.1 DUF2070 family protein [Methanocellales archaeon]
MKKGVDNRVSELSKYLFKAPQWTYSILFLLLFSPIIGISFDYGGWSDIRAGLLLIGMPATISALTSSPLTRTFGGNMTLNRSSLLSLIGTIIIGIFCITGALFSATLEGYIMALGVVFAIRTVILLLISSNSVWKMMIPASLQTLFGGVFLSLYTHSGAHYTNLIFGCIIFVLAFYLFARYIDAPMKKAFGVSGLDFIRGFITHTADGSSGIEDFFREMGEYVDAPVTVLNFKRDDKDKATFVIPNIHPGLMGEIGGGNLPAMITENFDSMVFVPHGPAYHDFNLVSADEIPKVVSAAKKALKNVAYTDLGSKSVRVKKGTTTILGQRFGDSILLTSSQCPAPTEDIEFAVGLTAMAETRVKGAKYAALIDAHNCTEPYAKVITPGSHTSYDIIKASSEATERLLENKNGRIKLGVSKRSGIYSPDKGVGALGIRVAVVEVLGQKSAYILIDGNNMVPGLRDAIIKVLPVDEAEVMTTDTHSVNFGGNNFIGAKIDHAGLIQTIREMTEEAIEDLEPVQAGMTTEFAEDVLVFGSYRTAQLASTVNAIISMGGGLAISIIVAALALAIFVFARNLRI